MRLYAQIKGIAAEDIEAVVDGKIAEMGLTEYADRMAAIYSGGNKRKLSVALAMIGEPSIVFLDGEIVCVRACVYVFVCLAVWAPSCAALTHIEPFLGRCLQSPRLAWTPSPADSCGTSSWTSLPSVRSARSYSPPTAW